MNIIVATDRDWGIGKDGDLLCHLPGDLRFFKEKTGGKTVIMGRKTLESLPGAKPLPGRRNIVLTRSMDYEKEGCEVIHSVSELTDVPSDAFVIGGAEIYAMLLPMTDTCYVTRMDRSFDADRFFPDLDEDPSFKRVYISEEHEENGIRYRFTTYKRVGEEDKDK